MTARVNDPAAPGAGAGEPGLLALWTGILGPPILWAIRLSGSYLLVPVVCRTGSIAALHALTAATLGGTLLIGILTYGAWRRSRASGGAPGARIRFMALIGVLSAGFFFAVIVAEGLANFLVHPCLNAGAPL